MYEIIKVNRWFKDGARVTSEKTLKRDAGIAEVMNIAKRQGADIDEVLEELEEYGITSFKGYMIAKNA